MTATANPARATVTALLAALAILGSALIPATVARADESTDASTDASWTVRTASNEFGADRTSYHYAVDPGNEVEDSLVIVNHGASPLDLGVYAADGYTTKSGQFDLVVAGSKSVAVGAWVTGTAKRVTVQPGQSVDYPFTVKVPKNATPGDYAGGIVTSLTEAGSTDNVNVDRRLGIRIGLRVGGQVTPGLAVENPRVDWDGGLDPFAGGDATLHYTLHNTGNATISAHQAATVSGPFGAFARTAARLAQPPQLLPGEKWNVTVRVRDVPAVVVLTATATITPTVTEASGSTTSMRPIEAAVNGAAVPWMLVLILLVVAAAIVVGLRWWRGRRVRQQEREDARVQEAVELALAGASERD